MLEGSRNLGALDFLKEFFPLILSNFIKQYENSQEFFRVH